MTNQTVLLPIKIFPVTTIHGSHTTSILLEKRDEKCAKTTVQ